MKRTKLELALLPVSQHIQEDKCRCGHASYHCLGVAAVAAAVGCAGSIIKLPCCKSRTALLLPLQLLGYPFPGSVAASAAVAHAGSSSSA
jgi:hypothetical protein